VGELDRITSSFHYVVVVLANEIVEESVATPLTFTSRGLVLALGERCAKL